ncbi:ABC transporter ATP-binding protein [Allorhizocola rhizosphaerae]|uniref:ABC transporter ATP-binding protein n=1 Tax=Allorhizocola rhizosphaerae TaxID=1872709 RepID=UPI000E3C14CA|nr:ABC transporter ATP-binding protein [Allorhizocola rhizosphaerae]
MDNVITVEHLHKRYGDAVAIEDVSFEVRRGEIFGILGPNGAGKSTTVECLQGLRSATRGRLAVLGLDPGREAARLRRRIGSQLQSSALPERLRVGEAIRLFARLHQQQVDVDATLAEWGLQALRRKAYATLSGGQQQRVFLALALLGRPEVVFLDELTTGLDPTARRETWQLVRRVRDRGATVVLVTHLMEEAEALCDRIAVIDRGRVVAADTPGALTALRGGPVRITFSVNGYDPRGLSSLAGVESVSIDAGRVTVTGSASSAVDVAAALAAQGIAPPDYRTHYPSLEDVFLALTGHRLTLTEGSPR